MDLDIKVPLGNMIINVFYINYESPYPLVNFPNHSHSSYELHFIPSGKGTLYMSGKKFNIVPGTFYLTGPGVYHEQTSEPSDPMSEYCINFELKLSQKKSRKNDVYVKDEIDEILKVLQNTTFWFGCDEYNSIEFFIKIKKELEEKTIGYYSYIQNMISSIILNAVRCLSKQKPSLYHLPKKILNDSRRFEVDNYFKDFERCLTPQDLANRIGTSVRQLNRILLEYYSMTFTEKLNASRLEYSKLLLENTELSVKEISEKTGFSNPNYFTSVFTKSMNMSPREYRSNNKKLDIK